MVSVMVVWSSGPRSVTPARRQPVARSWYIDWIPTRPGPVRAMKVAARLDDSASPSTAAPPPPSTWAAAPATPSFIRARAALSPRNPRPAMSLAAFIPWVALLSPSTVARSTDTVSMETEASLYKNPPGSTWMLSPSASVRSKTLPKPCTTMTPGWPEASNRSMYNPVPDNSAVLRLGTLENEYDMVPEATNSAW